MSLNVNIKLSFVEISDGERTGVGNGLSQDLAEPYYDMNKHRENLMKFLKSYHKQPVKFNSNANGTYL